MKPAFQPTIVSVLVCSVTVNDDFISVAVKLRVPVELDRVFETVIVDEVRDRLVELLVAVAVVVAFTDVVKARPRVVG